MMHDLGSLICSLGLYSLSIASIAVRVRCWVMTIMVLVLTIIYVIYVPLCQRLRLWHSRYIFEVFLFSSYLWGN